MWEPFTENQLRLAVEDGNLTESVALDCKREIGSTDGARRETAKDVASFAIHGGALLIGVAEDDDGRTLSLCPLSLAGEVERVEQIAANRIDPPVFVSVREIPSEADPDSGYLWVRVPPSPDAPHMVSGVYYARGERTTRRLTDAEVAALHRLREQRDRIADRLLDEEIARDPVPEGVRENGHLYLVAEPMSGSGRLGREVARSGNNTALLTLVTEAEHDVPEDIREWAPRPTYAGTLAVRSRGAALTSLGSGPRLLRPDQREENLVDIEVHESGGIRAVCGRLTAGRQSNLEPRPTQVILDGIAVAYALRLVAWARRIADRTGYRGAWALGMAGDRLDGLISSTSDASWSHRETHYDAAEYRRTTTAQYAELAEAPARVAERLVGPLMRGLNVARKYDYVLGENS